MERSLILILLKDKNLLLLINNMLTLTLPKFSPKEEKTDLNSLKNTKLIVNLKNFSLKILLMLPFFSTKKIENK
jgi:hypothetical protein